MKDLMSNPYVARLGGAAGAGIASYFATHDVKAAIITGITFLVYGAAHSVVSGAGAS